jgi:hypothetical protein
MHSNHLGYSFDVIAPTQVGMVGGQGTNFYHSPWWPYAIRSFHALEMNGFDYY